MYVLVVLGFVAAGKEVYKIIKRVSNSSDE